MSVINEMSPASGNVIGADGKEYNLVTLMGGGTPVSNRVYDVAYYQPRSALILGEDGKVYDLVQLIQSGGGKGGGVSDVKINGASIVSDGVAVIPVISRLPDGPWSNYSIIKYQAYCGYSVNNGCLVIREATDNAIKYRRNPGGFDDGFLTGAKVDLILRTAMCDGKGAEWSDSEKTGAWKRQTSIKTAMDDIAVAGAIYLLGEQSEVFITLPEDALPGQTVSVSWYNGDTAATFILAGNTLDFDFTPSANSRSEINALWDGTYWAVLGNELALPTEVIE